jgi:metal-responsive CopG/Arc/MetJ family transcriptional regulator
VAVRKIAISVPEHVLAQVDAAAAERGENRSRFITQMLVLLAQARTDREISRRVNAVFAEPEVVGEQRETARASSRVLARVVKSNGW